MRRDDEFEIKMALQDMPYRNKSVDEGRKNRVALDHIQRSSNRTRLKVQFKVVLVLKKQVLDLGTFILAG